MRYLFKIILLMIYCTGATAQTVGQQTVGSNSGFAIPRFASLASDTVNMRKGPSEDYQILWHFVQDNLPVEIIFEQSEWRKVRASDGTVGWMHRSVLNGLRTAIITVDNRATLYKASNAQATIKAYLETGVVVVVNTCEKDWCEVSINGLSGWLEKATLWGVYKDEIL